MIHPKRNDEATVTLTAYDARSEKVDIQTITGNLAPEIQYIEFADNARRNLKAIRIVMEVAYAVAFTVFLGVIFLSSIGVVGAQTLWCARTSVFSSPQCGYSIPAEPIPYADHDTSAMLEGWHDAMLWTLMKEEKIPLEMTYDWPGLSTATALASLFIGLWLVILSLCYWFDCRSITRKYWTKRNNE